MTLLAFVVLGSSAISCIIPDKDIMILVDCGARWCASAEFAEALDENGNVVQVQEGQPDGTSMWVTECVCMTPQEDLILQGGLPAMQYAVLRDQLINTTLQRCLDVAIANGYDPDPSFPQDELLDPSCAEAIDGIFRDGCCALKNSQCGGVGSCEANGTGGHETDPEPTETDGADSTTGEMSTLEGLYEFIDCAGTTCHIGQPLIDAVLRRPEAVLAEGTSLHFTSEDPEAAGLRLRDVEPEGLAWRLGLREGDIILRIDDLPLRDEAEVLTAVAHAHDAPKVTVLLRRDDVTVSRDFVRVIP